MPPISYARHRFPPVQIQYAGWLHPRFSLSYRDIEDLLAERGFEVSYETVRRWVLKFGLVFASACGTGIRSRPATGISTRRSSGSPTRRCASGAVDHEGEVIDVLVQRRRDREAAVKLRRKLLKRQGFASAVVVTDELRSYGTAFRAIGLSARHEQGRRMNIRAEEAAPSPDTVAPKTIAPIP